ncbi:iron(III) transport system ATP-binding protein [Sphaerotilus hippei]|uniref:Iron(III) transport system ATP-binding protein n=1 Tax=Sphaerotilus hippei TaxID=744406 RepID=A0A318H4T5_9BURK|nr:ABC transporter ATP-binding protein [Sphaerotilus hippei]PXW98832.1 iron(III) transport system ATP-binding protein [Sphaerotilus hippei]
MPSTNDIWLSLEHLSLRYGTQTIVDGLDLQLSRGSIGCLLGPSGCGKTTVLRAIAGFEPVSGGQILLDGRVVSSAAVHVPPEQRRIGMVFQDYALFPHLSVQRNVAFGLRGVADADLRVAKMLATVGLAQSGGKYPHELSGGQQQRVALARALVMQPALLLMDEPFSNLDVELRERLAAEVREIIKSHGTTAILVTHDQHEAFAVADQIGIMSGGHIQQWDSAYNLYHRPANRLVADFVGQGVFLPGEVGQGSQVWLELGTVHSGQPIRCTEHGDLCASGCQVDVLLRPDDVVHDDASPIQAEVVSKAFRGADILYTLRLGSGALVLSLVPSHHNHALGERIGIRLDLDHVVAYKRSGVVQGLRCEQPA